MFDVMNEAQSFGIFLQPTRYVMGIAPEARSVEFVGDIPQHGMNFSQLLLRLSGGAKGKNMAVTGRLIQYSLKEKDNLLGGRRYISIHLLLCVQQETHVCCVKLGLRESLP